MSAEPVDVDEDPRFTMGLVIDVLNVLDAHGYVRGGHQAQGAAVGQLLTLVRAYEGAVTAES